MNQMLHYQVAPEEAFIDHSQEVTDYLGSQRTQEAEEAMRFHLGNLPASATALSSLKCVLPALVYLPNKLETPPSLAIAPADAMDNAYLHQGLKLSVNAKQKKSRQFRNSPVASALIADDRIGRHLFLDDDISDEDKAKYQSEENTKAFKQLYGIDMVQAGDEFEESGLSVVGIVRVIGGARYKAKQKGTSEIAEVNRFLLDTFATLARNGKTSDVYKRLVRENAKYSR